MSRADLLVLLQAQDKALFLHRTGQPAHTITTWRFLSMSMKTKIKPVAAAIGVAFVTSLVLTPAAMASDNPFEATALDAGYMLAGEKGEEGKCGEDKGEEGKCGEGKCGEGKGEDGKCGEGKCGVGKCGEGKCGEEKGEEGKCGEDKGEEGSCGGSV
jgi:uncharacterized low-complexity protein